MSTGSLKSILKTGQMKALTFPKLLILQLKWNSYGAEGAYFFDNCHGSGAFILFLKRGLNFKTGFQWEKQKLKKPSPLKSNRSDLAIPGKARQVDPRKTSGRREGAG